MASCQPAVTRQTSHVRPASGEALRDLPSVFHYVNVGPDVPEHEMITDVYLPLR